MKLWGSLSHSFFFFQIFLKFFRVHVSIRIQEWVVLYHRLLCCFLLLDFPSFVVPSNGYGGHDLKPHRMFTPSTIPKTKRILVDSLVHQTPPRMKCCNASNRMEWNELFATLSQPSPTPPQAGQLIPIWLTGRYNLQLEAFSVAYLFFNILLFFKSLPSNFQFHTFFKFIYLKKERTIWNWRPVFSFEWIAIQKKKVPLIIVQLSMEMPITQRQYPADLSLPP